ncbi:hypothetical protein [Mitsuaria sp. BK037]|uniref:hypothetical protein n=1 Tax=Mitsuaria sp. BK037 TaxID=2587122 RepID=UPI0016153B86|nr:hypothetical protein [Mitsuaria sp. BK037]MBB3284945.1 hypothetical protein [Mitsuaria sp. BK037]
MRSSEAAAWTDSMALISLQRTLAASACAWMTCGAIAAPDSAALATDPAAMTQLVEAVTLDVISELSVSACEDVGAPSAPQMRDAWVGWRTRYQLPPLRVIVTRVMTRKSSDPPWDKLVDPVRKRVLTNATPDQACVAMAREWDGPGMDIAAKYPQAMPVARALVQAKLVAPPTPLPVAVEPARGKLLLPSQVVALTAQRGSWLAISDEAALRKMGQVYVKGRVARDIRYPERFHLVQERGGRQAEQLIHLKFNAEPWVGREIVLRGVVTSLSRLSMDLADAALVNDASGLTVSPLQQAPLARKEVLLQRVMSAPGQGLSEKDLVAVVLHGEANYNYGTRWEEDVRFLLKDGTVYRRTEMPPDQLNVAASRQLEPRRWGRWRSTGKGYEMQEQDDDGRPLGEWKLEKHVAMKPWPKDARLEGSFSRSSFNGSMVTGGTSATRGIRFTKDGRFERSYSALSSTGSLQAITGTVIAGSSQGDGSGSSSTGGGTVGTGLGTVGATSGTRTKDDGASRRGRYQLSGYAITLTYDDGHEERLLSFPVDGNGRSVYVGSGSYDLSK